MFFGREVDSEVSRVSILMWEAAARSKTFLPASAVGFSTRDCLPV